MVYKSNKKLSKLSDKQIFEDVKKFIKSSHTFYKTTTPEIKVLAKRLHDEYSLKDFYKVFERLWKSDYKEKSLAIYTFQMYKDDFNINTWKFLKPKLKEIKSWDKLDDVSINIIGEILLRERRIEKDILRMIESKDVWIKRMGIMSIVPSIKDNLRFVLKVCESNMYNENRPIQEAVGIVLREMRVNNENISRKFISKNMNMPLLVFDIATENMKDLRIRRIKPANGEKFLKLLFLKK